MNRGLFGFVGWLVFAWGGVFAAPPPQGVDLARLDGWDIVIAKGRIPSEQYAAEELQDHVAQATGHTLPTVTEVDRPDRHLFVGVSEAMRKSSVGFAVEDVGPEDLRIVIRDGNIAIAGGRPRGTLYGVYVFLEDYLGVRFLTAEHTHIPPVGDWRLVGPVDRFYHPPLEMRWSYYGEVNRNPAFAARRRVNTVARDAKFGGVSKQGLINHSFHWQIPSSRYGREHPEYYCLRDGRRLSQVQNDARDNEPCLTNPDVLRIVTEAVLARLDSGSSASNISVSQNDNDKYCQCPNCAAIDEREGTPMGSLLTFVNAVADAVAKERPEIHVGTLAYWYSRQPPKTVKPQPNVQIQLCSIECCLIHAINDPNCPRNVAFCRDVSGWGAICDKIYIWNYNTNFRNYLLPLPNLRVIEPNVRYFVANNARGAFMQAAGNANGAELSELRNYIISGLIWDPNRSGQQLMDEFLDLHYAEAAEPIRRYVRRIHDRAEASGKHRNCFGNLADYGLDETDAQAGIAAFAHALELAKSDAVRTRVERASICAYRAAIEPIWYERREPFPPELVERMRPLVKRFFQLCEKHQVDRASETGPDTAGHQTRLKPVFGRPDVGIR